MDKILFGILLIIVANLSYIYWKKRKELLNLREINFELLTKTDEIKKTLLLGIYQRFSSVEGDDPKENEERNPTGFEHFVGEIMKKYYGGEVFVSGGPGDFGVDIEHKREDGVYFGQVKRYAENNDVPFDPIALIHSNMVKEKATGGFVVTTGNFTEQAKKYNKDLNIELIDGLKLVDYWLEGLEKELYAVDNGNELELEF